MSERPRDAARSLVRQLTDLDSWEAEVIASFHDLTGAAFPPQDVFVTRTPCPPSMRRKASNPGGCYEEAPQARLRSGHSSHLRLGRMILEISVPADPARMPAFEDVSNADNEPYIRPW